MELEDIDDLPQEFKGGTLEISAEEFKLSTVNIENKEFSPTNNNKNGLGSSLISPIISIPQRITETIRNKPNNSNNNSTSLKPAAALLITGSANDFFTFRQSIIEHAVKECVEQFIDVEADGPLWAAFLLTEISLWDAEKERLILITPKTLVIVKYDFIALRRLEYKKLALKCIDTIVIGDIIYPPTSIVPNRNMRGIRLMWNNGKPLNFGSKWNPLCNDVPFTTFIAHPLFFHKDCTNEDQRKVYDVEEFIENICSVVSNLISTDNEAPCLIHHKNIMMDNYIGIGSLIHNRNALGFFKVRGRFSF